MLNGHRLCKELDLRLKGYSKEEIQKEIDVMEWRETTYFFSFLAAIEWYYLLTHFLN